MTSVTKYERQILIKDKSTNEYVDKTSSYEKTRTGYTVVFRSNAKTYNFNFEKISVYGSPKVVKTDGAVVTINLNAVENIDIVIEFDSYLKIFYINKKTELHKKSAVKIEYSCLEEPRVQ